MTDTPIRLEAARTRGLDRVEALLEQNDLPTADVRAKPDCFFVATVDGDVVGVGGLERNGTDGLLRSVVVEESSRGRGYGTALCEALEARARTDGVETLYLLTTTATAFFERRGYEAIARERVPPGIRATDEFTDLCPAAATCMRKAVGRE